MFCLCYADLIAQSTYTLKLVNRENEPIQFAVGITQDSIIISNSKGKFYFKNKPKNLEVHALGYKSINIDDVTQVVQLISQKLPDGDTEIILEKFTKSIYKNDPFSLDHLSFTKYNRSLLKRDSLKTNENLFSERISEFYINNNKESELILAQKNQGFERPILKILANRIHSLNWYSRYFMIFDTDYASPLHPLNYKAYDYQLIYQNKDSYYIKFTPKIRKREKLLEGVFCLDKNFAFTRIHAALNDEIKLNFDQTNQYNKDIDAWLPLEITIRMNPGKGGKRVSLFGANIAIGTLQDKSISQSDLNNELFSQSIFYDYSFEKNFITNNYDVLVDNNAHEYDNTYWDSFRKIPLTNKDSLFFKETIKTQERKKLLRQINTVQNVNNGFFPILKWKTDLKTLIKINNYEGLRVGLGGLTNEKFSEKFRIGGYIAYGTKDETVKYGVNTGFLLNRNKNMWLNAKYEDDVREVGSNFYLTDQRVYSFFEPRLVNIIFFYKEKTASLSLEKRISPKLISEFKIAHDRIFQTQNYAYLDGDIAIESYDLTRALLSLRWSPKSKFLKFDNKFINFKEQYPVFSGQIEQYFGNTFGGDLTFTKLNLKSEYIISHLNNHRTEFSIEGNLAFGDVPLTHSYHAFPNAPNKSSILRRFSVAGVKSFETMFFSEFFSTKLASLHMKHRFAPFKISNTLRPELVLISRHAIGDFSNQSRHLGIDFNTLENGYSEAGLELNKIFWGFGLSFAYRYGAYHLPIFEDNISFKFTFNLKL